MSSVQPTSRPWYCFDPAVDDYLTVLREGGDFRMLKALKIIRTITVNAGFIAIALYALSLGADPTIVGAIGLVSLAAYNGIEIGDYAALAQAFVEVTNETSEGDSR